ncbi:MAG: 30S ribosome-binding factor RbfA [Hyphomicrobiales bacterium]
MESKRQQKVAKQIQKDLGEIFQLEAKNKFKGALITVTKVNVTRDLASAKVNLSLFGFEDNEALLKLIRDNSKDIRHELGRRIRHQMRIVPNLLFYIDDSLDYIENIENLLNE